MTVSHPHFYDAADIQQPGTEPSYLRGRTKDEIFEFSKQSSA